MAILTPSAVKLSHVFENHDHVVCESPLTTHFHQLDWDCEFYKFKLNNQFNYVSNTLVIIEASVEFDRIIDIRDLYNPFTLFNSNLRGPPTILI